MNAIEQAQRAYTSAQSPLRTARSTEHRAFSDVTIRMTRAMQSGASAFAELAAALHDNRKLWTLLAADVADDGNLLPRDLRARIFYLAEFTAVHSSRVLHGEASAEALIAINTSVIRGLSGFAAVGEGA